MYKRKKKFKKIRTIVLNFLSLILCGYPCIRFELDLDPELDDHNLNLNLQSSTCEFAESGRREREGGKGMAVRVRQKYRMG